MTLTALAQLGLFVTALCGLAVLLSIGLQRVFTPAVGATRLDAVAGRLLGDAARHAQDWRAYARSVLTFSLLCLLAAYVLLRLQHALPLNPHHARAMPWDVSFNTAVSFVSNTSWQYYAGESSLSFLSQMVVIAGESFLSAAVGLAVAVAVVRGLTRRDGRGELGNFWCDLTRGLLLVILPICALATVAMLVAGTPQGLGADAVGPVATWTPIKTLGSVGGGFFNVNSAHPYENPNAATSTLQALLILVVPAALLLFFGRQAGDRRQGRTLLALTAVLFAAGAVALSAAEHRVTPAQAAAGVHGSSNLEGKEQRFGDAGTALYATATTAGASGAVNGAMESLSGAGAGIALANMLTGETIFGGLGSGLTGVLLLALLAVFLASLMVGRAPAYLGKRIAVREMKLISLAVLAPPLIILLATTLAVATPYGGPSRYAADSAQAFTEHLWAYTSQGVNNGSAFAGYTGYVSPPAAGEAGGASITFAQLLGAFAMLAGRYLPLILALAVAGGMAGRRVSPASAGTLRTDGTVFAVLLAGVIIVVALLDFLPALLLGPVAMELK
jgi:K+-transporting ATPase ATPase A chain